MKEQYYKKSFLNILFTLVGLILLGLIVIVGILFYIDIKEFIPKWNLLFISILIIFILLKIYQWFIKPKIDKY